MPFRASDESRKLFESYNTTSLLGFFLDLLIIISERRGTTIMQEIDLLTRTIENTENIMTNGGDPEEIAFEHLVKIIDSKRYSDGDLEEMYKQQEQLHPEWRPFKERIAERIEE
jgi:hypothetical protein